MASTSQDFVSGQVLTAAEMDMLSQGILDYQSSTSTTAAISTETTLLTASAITPAQTNRRFKLTFHCRGVTGLNATDTFIFSFKEGATLLNETHYVIEGTAIWNGVDFVHVIDSPTAAAHTYSVTFKRATGTQTATVSATATAPMFLIVEDCGSA